MDLLIKTLSIYGLAIVVSLSIAVLIKAVVVALGRLEPKQAPSLRDAVAQPTLPPTLGVPAEHVAVIAAAVHAVATGRRIVHIEPVRHHDGWLAEGRHAHHASHDFGHRPKH